MKFLFLLLIISFTNSVFSMTTVDPIKIIKNYQNEAKDVWLKDYAILATIDKDGYPKQRMMRINEIKPDGLIFHAYNDSSKVKEFSHRPASMELIFWQNKHVIQINIQGKIEVIGFSPSKYYRPRTDSRYFAYKLLPSSIKITIADSLKRENQFFTHQQQYFQLKQGQWQSSQWNETFTKYDS